MADKTATCHAASPCVTQHEKLGSSSHSDFRLSLLFCLGITVFLFLTKDVMVIS